MTNWVANRWDVAGAEADLDAFQRLLLPEPARPGLLDRFGGRPADPPAPDFDRVLPPPPGLGAEPGALADWRLAHWGTARPPLLQGFERAPGRARLAFATAWSHPAGVAAALASRLPPALVVEGAYVEEGNEHAGRFRLAGGICEDHEVPFTPAFFEEVTGEPLDEG